MTAYLHANTLREGANTSERPRLFRGITYALLIELLAGLAFVAWRWAL